MISSQITLQACADRAELLARENELRRRAKERERPFREAAEWGNAALRLQIYRTSVHEAKCPECASEAAA
jgi:hypothetical protein